MTTPTQPTPPEQQQTPPASINDQAVAALEQLGAVPVVLIIPLNGPALDAQSNIALPTGWRWHVGYVERQK